jgi:NitT/TauT family transport system ATP-binding protein
MSAASGADAAFGGSPDGEALIGFHRVSKSYARGGKDIPALGLADFQVCRGEFVAIVGPSGCGKSTLLNLMAGLMKPTSGSVTYAGVQVTSVNQRIGYVTQGDTLLPWRNIQANVALPLEIRGMARHERDARAGEMIDRVGLQGFARHYPSELSGGMRRRAILARALVYDPETLAMDEPFGALDAQLKTVLHQQLLELWQGTGKTVVFVTHDLEEAVTLADRVVVFSARPAVIRAIKKVDLARPRDVINVKYGTRFGELSRELWEIISDDMLKGTDM